MSGKLKLITIRDKRDIAVFNMKDPDMLTLSFKFDNNVTYQADIFNDDSSEQVANKLMRLAEKIRAQKRN